MAERGDQKGGITRRELFRRLGSGALAGGLLPPALAGAAAAAAATGAPEVKGPGRISLTLQVNGKPRTVEVEPRATLLDVLRGPLALTGAKRVCDRGACGACTVHLGGQPVMACMLLALDAVGRPILTIEGLAEGDTLHPLQEAFIDHDALQCGFCTPGMLMSCAALLAANPHPRLGEVKAAVAGNLCRCGTYPRVFAATLAVAGAKRGHHG